MTVSEVSDNSLGVESIQSKAILDSINEGILILDKEDKVTRFNERFESVFKINDESWIGKSIKKLYDHIFVYGKLTELVEFEKLFISTLGKNNLIGGQSEFVIQIPELNIQRYINAYTAPIIDQKSGYIGRIWKFEDISKEKQLDQAKTEFISIASHQLRTPLTAITGYLEMVNMGDYGEVPENLLEPLEAVTKSSMRMRDLVNDLLNISRLESGTVAAQFTDFELVKTLKDEIENQREIIDKEEIKINFDSNKLSIKINSDPKLVSEIFKNYLSNAIKYSHKSKEVSINIEILNDKVKITISDKGIGIPKDAQSHLFNKFFRAENVLKNDYEGTGLGLYYIKKVVTALRGTVGFSSVVNKGSEFWFSLPLSK